MYKKYGPPEVLSVQEVDRPEIKPNQVLVRVVASTVCTGDVRIRGMDIPSPIFMLPARLVMGVFGPRKQTPGTELSGVIEEIGSQVTRFSIGDHVFANPGFKGGGNGEFCVVDGDGPIDIMASNQSFEEAAGVLFGGFTALYFLRDQAKIQSHHRVLINGASGSLGTHGIQIAKHYGAHVTAVCSQKNHELVQSLGADEVIDYTAQDITSGDQTYDIIFDTVGKTSFKACKRIMNPNGVFLAPVMTLAEILQTIYTRWIGDKRVIGGITTEKHEDLLFLRDLIEAGELKTVIDRVYSLDEIVEAHRHVDSGRKRGQVIIRVSADPQ